MNRWISVLMAPFLALVAILVVWGATNLLFLSAGVIANVLRAFLGWMVGTLPRMIVTTFSDPWKIAALPMAVGVVILVGWWAWNDLTNGSRSQVLRGRELGSPRPHERLRSLTSRKNPPAQNGRRSRWTRSNLPRH